MAGMEEQQSVCESEDEEPYITGELAVMFHRISAKPRNPTKTS